ncbi:MAG: DUF2490 domain-containing protein [Saprospiraceae bacterium]
MRYKVETHFKISSWLSLLAFDEILINLCKNIIFNTIEHNNLGLGLQISPVKNIRFEVTYINWLQQLSSGNQYFKRDILCLTLNHVLTFEHKSDTI